MTRIAPLSRSPIEDKRGQGHDCAPTDLYSTQGSGNNKTRDARVMETFKYQDKAIFIFGAPRSGTSWLAKIFDAHPDVLYRHEPDISIRGSNLPFFCIDNEIPSYTEATAVWLNALAENKRLKSAGSWPVFTKSFHSRIQNASRLALIMGLKLLERVPCIGRAAANSVDVPDFLDLDADRCRRIVIKSVSGMGRIGLVAAAAPDSQIIVTVRHPCGQVASMIRGIRAGMFEDDFPVTGLSGTPVAARFGLTADKLAAETLVGKLAWSWVIHNEIAAEAAEKAHHGHVVRYFDLARQPEMTSRMLFELCGLDWRSQIAQFLSTSTHATGRERYYQLVRDPIQAATRWTQELPQDDIANILRIADNSQVFHKLFEGGNNDDSGGFGA